MNRLFYKHFNDDVPNHIEREYNKLLRKEKYLEERDKEFILQRVDFEEIQESIPDPKSLPENEIESENQKIHEKRLDFLPIALEMLRCDFPEGYVLIHDYYLSGEKTSVQYLTEKYGLTANVVRYRLKLARKMLKSS